MSKSLISTSKDFIAKLEMLNELMTTEWESQEDKELFEKEIVESLVGDETTMMQKVVNIKSFIDAIDDNIERAKKWREDMKRQERIAESMKERIKEYALFVLKTISAKTGEKSIESNGIKITYQFQGKKNRLNIKDEDLIPHKYFNNELKICVPHGKYYEIRSLLLTKGILPQSDLRVVDNEKIIADLISGEKIEGAELLPQAEGIRIKNTLPKEDL